MKLKVWQNTHNIFGLKENDNESINAAIFNDISGYSI
jgi:hypothetical protein